jgi:hypothetical protein
MVMVFPTTEQIQVPHALARDLLKAAELLPLYDNKEFYSPELQKSVSDGIRETSPDGFDWLISLIKERLVQWPYWVLLSGLQFDEGNKVFVAINRAFGELVARPYEKPRAQLVHYIQPQTDLKSARGGWESERLHTDTADWPTPVELISMVCVRADKEGGGRSRVLDVESVRKEVRGRLGEQTLQLLESEPVPWLLADDCGGGVDWRPVLTKSSICWRRYTIDHALDSGGATLSQKMLAALQAFEELIANTPLTADFLMREGELLFSNNVRTVHSRTPISSAGGSERLMIRSWIRTSQEN